MTLPMAPLKVLHLDDNPFERERLARALSNGGCIVSSVATPADFEFELAAAKPDLVILDFHLDETASSTAKGLDLVPSVRDRHPRAIIFMLSSTTDEEDIRAAVAAAVDDFFAKETDDSDRGLCTRLRQAYTVARMRRQLRATE